MVAWDRRAWSDLTVLSGLRDLLWLLLVLSRWRASRRVQASGKRSRQGNSGKNKNRQPDALRASRAKFACVSETTQRHWRSEYPEFCSTVEQSSSLHVQPFCGMYRQADRGILCLCRDVTSENNLFCENICCVLLS